MIPISKRRSIKVEELKNHINGQLGLDISEDARATLCSLLEEVLHTTRNYQGYQNRVWWCEGGYEQWCQDGKPEGLEKFKMPYHGEEFYRMYF